MASGVISPLQQVGVATQADRYVSAFVTGMLYNQGVVLLVCMLLLMLARVQSTAE